MQVIFIDLKAAGTTFSNRLDNGCDLIMSGDVWNCSLIPDTIVNLPKPNTAYNRYFKSV